MCRANSPLGMGVHHELAQDEQSRRADHTRHTLRTRQSDTRHSSASTETASFTTGLAKTGLSRRRDRVDLQWYECDKSQSQAVRESVAVRESPPVSIRAELPLNGSQKKSESHRQSQSTLSPHQMAHQRPAQRRGWLRTSRGTHSRDRFPRRAASSNDHERREGFSGTNRVVVKNVERGAQNFRRSKG